MVVFSDFVAFPITTGLLVAYSLLYQRTFRDGSERSVDVLERYFLNNTLGWIVFSVVMSLVWRYNYQLVFTFMPVVVIFVYHVITYKDNSATNRIRMIQKCSGAAIVILFGKIVYDILVRITDTISASKFSLSFIFIGIFGKSRGGSTTLPSLPSLTSPAVTTPEYTPPSYIRPPMDYVIMDKVNGRDRIVVNP